MIKRIPAIIFVSLLLFTGCSKEKKQDVSDVSNNISTKQEYNNDLDTKNDVSNESPENQEKIQEKIDESNEIAQPKSSYKFKIYTSNEESDGLLEIFVENIDYNNPIKYNLQELSNMLVKDHFKDDSIKINLVSIDKNDIATVDLLNEENWLKYFQGSTGGNLTQEVITKTLLQNDYDGNWIKGIKILVDGKENKEYDHISFTEIFER